MSPKKLCAVICLLSVGLPFMTAVPSAYAQPSPGVRWLMSEPASLFDIGMFRLHSRAERLADQFAAPSGVGQATPSVSYDFERNHILVKIEIFAQGAPSAEACQAFLKPLRSAMTGAGALFSHNGYQSPARPRNLAEEVDSRIRLEIELNDNLTSRRGGGPVICRGPLVTP